MYSDETDIGPSEVDTHMEQAGLAETIAGGPIDGVPEFRQHECWRMLLVSPDESDPAEPGRIECLGCGAIYRAEVEFKP